jgi:hypothetical protein
MGAPPARAGAPPAAGYFRHSRRTVTASAWSAIAAVGGGSSSGAVSTAMPCDLRKPCASLALMAKLRYSGWRRSPWQRSRQIRPASHRFSSL